MSLRYNIEDLKKEFIGKIAKWLTVLDVYRNSKYILVCKCKCKCVNETIVPLKYIRNGRAKSCGCFRKSKEFSDKLSQWYKDNPDKVEQRSSKYREWCKNNDDFLAEKGMKHSEWYSNHPEVTSASRHRMIDMNVSSNKERATLKRIESVKYILETSDVSDSIHSEDLQKLLSGDLTSESKIRTKCPQCGLFSEHNVKDTFNISKRAFKQFRLCNECSHKFSVSKYEQEIANYISTFYSGELIRNSREIISPFELDLYYPEKKIAVEFNGDYWHSEEFKSSDYHYNKFKSCFENNIMLVSIFESEWNSRKSDILLYLKDLFFDRQNSLSIINDYFNNNYPYRFIKLDDSNYIEYYYMYRDKKVYTAGFSIISKI